MKESKILDKIKKLLAAAESENKIGNLEAGKLLAEKVGELLAKYKISLSDAQAAADRKENPFAEIKVTPADWSGGEDRGRQAPRHIVEVAIMIAENFFCRAVYYDDTEVIGFVGRHRDAEIASYIFICVMRAAIAECETEIATDLLTPRPLYPQGSIVAFLAGSLPKQAKGEDFRESFFYGLAYAIKERFTEQAAQRNTCAALVKASREVDEHLKDLGVKEEDPAQRKNVSELDGEAARKGAAVGAKINLSANGIYDGRAEDRKENNLLLGE